MLFLPTDHSPVFPAHRHFCSQSQSPLRCTITEQQHTHTQFDSMKERECLVYRSELLGRWRKWTLPANRKRDFAPSKADGGMCVHGLTQKLTVSKLSSNSWFLIIILQFFSYCIFAVCLVGSAWIKFLIPQCYVATTRSRMTSVINVLIKLVITIENSYQNIVLRSDSSHGSIPVFWGKGLDHQNPDRWPHDPILQSG